MPLLENNEIISKDKSVAEPFNDYFANITNSLRIEETGKITKFSLHSSIKRIRENYHSTQKFEFQPCSTKDVMTQLERLDQKTASSMENIPAKVLKENSDLLLLYLSSTYNSGILKSYFPDELKSRDIFLLFKKVDAFNKKNYRPITVPSLVSKIFQ